MSFTHLIKLDKECSSIHFHMYADVFVSSTNWSLNPKKGTLFSKWESAILHVKCWLVWQQLLYWKPHFLCISVESTAPNPDSTANLIASSISRFSKYSVSLIRDLKETLAPPTSPAPLVAGTSKQASEVGPKLFSGVAEDWGSLAPETFLWMTSWTK